MKSKKRVDCPTCRERFHLDSWLRIGDQLLCPHCEELLEVVKMNPISLGYVNTIDSVEFEDSSNRQL